MKRSTLVVGTAAAAVSFPYIARSQSLTKVVMAGPQGVALAPVVYAIRKGMYRDQGLDVELGPISSGAVAATAVIAGAYQMSNGSCIASLVTHLRGLPLTVVANGAVWSPKTPFALAVVAADSSIKTAADLGGRTAGSPALNDMNQLSLSAWIDKTGGDSKSVRWVEVPNSAAMEALVQKRIDVYVMNEPQLTAAIDSGRLRALAPVYSAIADYFAFATYSANADWALGNRDAVRRWTQTTYAAAAYTNAHHSEILETIADYTKIPVDVVRKMAPCLGAVSSNAELVQPAINAAAHYGYIPKVFPAKDLYFS
jgi:NitT/TauT family transport system substrate-binding protein